MARPRGQFDEIIPEGGRDRLFGISLDEAIKTVSGQPEGKFRQAWEVESAPKPVLQMRMEGQTHTDGRSK